MRRRSLLFTCVIAKRRWEREREKMDDKRVKRWWRSIDRKTAYNDHKSYKKWSKKVVYYVFIDPVIDRNSEHFFIERKQFQLISFILKLSAQELAFHRWEGYNLSSSSILILIIFFVWRCFIIPAMKRNFPKKNFVLRRKHFYCDFLF